MSDKTEGQLKKQIEQVGFSRINSYGDLDYGLSTDQKKAIYKILDAARADFPKITPIHRFEPDEHGDIAIPLEQTPDSPYINDYLVDGEALKAWRDKWFGAP